MMAGDPGAERSAGSRIYEVLKAEIIAGTLAPGQKLSERTMAERFETSRLPLRDAVQRLIAEGFMFADPRKGTRVATIPERDLEDLFDVRESLEVLAAKLAAARCDEASGERLRGHIADAKAALAAGDSRAVVASNAAFHEEVIAVSRNELLRSLMTPLNDKIRWVFGAYTARPLHVLVEDHERLCGLIVAGDVEAIADAAYVHVHDGRTPRAVPSIPVQRGTDGQAVDPLRADAETRVRAAGA
jgi:DNA-binding GntR family transcriptional regulator